MPKPQPIHERFSDDEMGQVKRYGHAMGGNPTPFEEELQQELDAREAARNPTALASEHMREQGPPGAPPPQGPVPAQETVSQPAPAGGKKQGKQKPPSGTTPAGIGEETVKPPGPQGEY